jgi:hypothetical protein
MLNQNGVPLDYRFPARKWSVLLACSREAARAAYGCRRENDSRMRVIYPGIDLAPSRVALACLGAP